MNNILEAKDPTKFVRFLDKGFNEVYLDSFDMNKIPLKEGCYLNKAQLLELSKHISRACSLINPANIKKIGGEDWYFVNNMIKNVLPQNEEEKNRKISLEGIFLEKSSDDLFFIGTKNNEDSAGFVNYNNYKKALYIANLGKDEKKINGIGGIILNKTKSDRIEITLLDSEDNLIRYTNEFLFSELDLSKSFIKMDYL